jgi:heme oxygenase
VTTDAPPLSARLRAETRDAHTRAERSGIMRRVLRGEIARPDYVALLRELACIYDALESELDRHRAHPLVAPFDMDTLRRLPALRRDLAALDAPETPASDRADAACDATRAYVRRLREVGASEPARLVAHAYVRYLGDLSGGQILAGIVRRALALDDEAGTAFYDFAPHDVDPLKRRFRTTLDALPLDAATADALVDEAVRAFALHEALFVELDDGR